MRLTTLNSLKEADLCWRAIVYPAPDEVAAIPAPAGDDAQGEEIEEALWRCQEFSKSRGRARGGSRPRRGAPGWSSPGWGAFGPTGRWRSLLARRRVCPITCAFVRVPLY